MIEYTENTLYARCDCCHNPVGILNNRDSEELARYLKKIHWEFDPETGAGLCADCLKDRPAGR